MFNNNSDESFRDFLIGANHREILREKSLVITYILVNFVGTNYSNSIKFSLRFVTISLEQFATCIFVRN